MINHRFQSRVRSSIGVAVPALAVFLSSAVMARPEPRAVQVAQTGEPTDPLPAAKPRPRKPAPKPQAFAVGNAEASASSIAAAETVAPAAAPVQASERTQPARTDQPAEASQPAPADQTAQPAAPIIAEPVRHAREAKLARCVDTVSRASSSTIDTAHAAVSTWSQKGPDEHMFQSIVALSYSNTIAPKAATVLVAAPEGTGCEATTVQVYPTTRSCGDVEGDLKKAGRNVGDFGGVAMTQEQGTSRHLLLPAPGTGCVVVAVGLALNQ
jgi:hypothetical protein